MFSSAMFWKIILESFIENTEEFIPTNEWQIVKEGMAIFRER